MSDQENHLNTNCQGVITPPNFPGGYGIVAAANIKPTSYIFAIDGKKIIELTKEMGEGKIVVSDEHLKTLVLKNAAAAQAVWTILNHVKDDTAAGIVREALKTYFINMLNEFHKDLNKLAESNGR